MTSGAWKQRVPNLAAALLLVPAQISLRSWYASRSVLAAWIAASCMGLFLALLLWQGRNWFRGISRARLILLTPWMALLIPWGEILHQQGSYSRENWSLQLVNQLCVLFAFGWLANSVNLREERLAKGIARISRWPLWAVPGILLIACLFLSHIVYDRTPLISDSQAYLFQSKIFAAGRFVAPAPPIPEFFDNLRDHLAIFNGVWVSQYPPGYSLMLALFHPDPWVLSPLLGFLTLIIWMKYVSRWHSRSASLITGVFLAISPLVLVMSSSVMIHTPELFLVSACVYLSRRVSEKPSHPAIAGLGFLLCFAVLLRGFSILVFLAPILAYALWLIRTASRRWSAGLAGSMVVGVAAGVVLLGLYNGQVTGSFWSTTYNLEFSHHYGLGPTKTGQVHTLLKAVENTSNNLLGLNSWLLGGITGSMVFLLAYAVFCRFEKWDLALAAGCLALLGFYFFFFFQDLVSGPRFLYPAAPVVLMLIARLPSELPEPARRIVLPLLLIGVLTAPAGILRYAFHKANPARYESGAFFRSVKSIGNGVVVLMPEIDQTLVSANDPLLRSGMIIARDRGSRNEQLQETFDRPLYFFSRNTEWSASRDDSQQYVLTESRPSEKGIEFSFYDIALAVATANQYETSDLFDICYLDIFAARGAAEGLTYAERRLPSSLSVPDYRSHFRMGMYSLVRILLLPKLAYEQAGTKWVSVCDFAGFRKDFVQARAAFQKAGDVGVPAIRQLDKIGKRADQNRDGSLSDSELAAFLEQKIVLLETP